MKCADLRAIDRDGDGASHCSKEGLSCAVTTGVRGVERARARRLNRARN